MTIRAVAFDFYATLAHEQPGYPKARVMFAENGFEFPPAMGEIFWSSSVDGTDHSEHSASAEDYAAWVRRRRIDLFAEHGVGPDDAERLVDAYDQWEKGFSMVAYPEVRMVLHQLRERGLRIGVCSNWDWDFPETLDQSGIADLIDYAVASAQAGCRKPHPRIFEALLDGLGCRAEEVVFVGDNWDADVVGARNAGLHPVHVWRPTDPYVHRVHTSLPELVDGVERVTSLDEIVSLVVNGAFDLR